VSRSESLVQRDRPLLDWGNAPPWATGRAPGYGRGDDGEREPAFWREPGFWLGFALGAMLVAVVGALVLPALL